MNFIKFTNKLKNKDNKALVEAIQSGYKALHQEFPEFTIDLDKARALETRCESFIDDEREDVGADQDMIKYILGEVFPNKVPNDKGFIDWQFNNGIAIALEDNSVLLVDLNSELSEVKEAIPFSAKEGYKYIGMTDNIVNIVNLLLK
jgi:hypothetical protein